ncbi:hypothetical protein [Hymenobacter norwichensis]|uniref:hypothetical protein n=1 Tax=Hymenobacter norwichensis TaxID=223903 RepID=UPI000421F006|nr:hypothetical protein [Hymenobacter norwichensis]
MKFFPVCQLDTANVAASLRNAGIGLSFYTNRWYWLIRPTTYGHVQSPFKEKMVTLTTTDPLVNNVHCWDCGLNEIFIIPVHIRLSDTLRIYPPNQEVYNDTLHTQQGSIALRFRSTSTIVLQELSPR